MLYRYMYLSSATDQFAHDDIEDILTTSHRNNEPVGITGLLVMHERRFLQVLEGPKDDVTRCVNRIKHDARHDGIFRLSSGPVQDRAFPRWRMGFAMAEELLAEGDAPVFSIADLARPYSADRGNAPEVRAAIREFLAGFRFLRPRREVSAAAEELRRHLLQAG